MTSKEIDLLDQIKFANNGLIPAVAQDCRTGEILMLAWMNKEALKKTIETGWAHYFSRSRNKLWKKGETSGQIQKIIEILIDCDHDSLVLKVEQNGVSCHTGRRSCFFSSIGPNNNIQINQPVIVNPEDLYEKNNY